MKAIWGEIACWLADRFYMLFIKTDIWLFYKIAQTLWLS